MGETEKRIEQYWDKRAPSYTEVVRKNLEDRWDAVWADMLISSFPPGEPEQTRVLDIGTGPGFYAIILAKRGYRVTAVDLSEKMLAEARRNAGELAEKIEFLRMDAQTLDFPDETFDAIVTRNLTWNLPDPLRAYGEWKRVLRPEGALVIFDANWYAYLNDEEKRLAREQDLKNIETRGVTDIGAYADKSVMEDISRDLPMTARRRPQWDVAALLDLGFSAVSADVTVSDTVWNPEEKINYASTPGFLIRAVK